MHHYEPHKIPTVYQLIELRAVRNREWQMKLFVLWSLLSIANSVNAAAKEVGNCGQGLSCNVFLRLQTDVIPIMLVAGFAITGSTNGSAVTSPTKEKISKNSPFRYRSLSQDLMKSMGTDLAKNKCDKRTDLVALALFHSIMDVTNKCTVIGSPECSTELPALKCGNPASAAILPMPWESLLPPVSSTFDSDGSNFDILARLIRSSGMESTLVGAKDITLLAPNDEAFGRSVRYMGAYNGDPSNETAVYEVYNKMAKEGMTIKGVNMPGDELMKFFLAYHIVSDQQPADNFQGLPRSMTTAATVPLLSIGTQELIDISSVTPNANIVEKDLPVQGGVTVHSIDAVLLPFEVSVNTSTSFDCKVKKAS